MKAASKPWWQQATAVVGIGASGAISSFSFSPGTPHTADPASPAQVRLLALQQVAKPAQHSDAALRAAIVHVAKYYLRLSADATPAEMEELIWQHDSLDGVDHGPSCAAFASLTLEMGSRAIGQQSWVTGGSSYPWPLHNWADVRVDPNPASPAVVSVLSDAQAQGRWHPLGDGYKPKPGDWVLFDGHVEVVTKYAGGVLYTIGGDSLPNFSVNAHEYAGPLSAQGVAGFVNNGNVHTTSAKRSAAGQAGRAGKGASRKASGGGQGGVADSNPVTAAAGAAAVPGTSTPAADPAAAAASSGTSGGSGNPTGSAVPAQSPARGQWHASHPRTNHRPARPVHQHPPGAKPGGDGAPAGGTAGGSGGGGASGAGSTGVAAGTATASVPGAAPGAVSLGSPAPFQKAANGGAVIPGLSGPAHHHAARQAATDPGHGPQPQAHSAQSAQVRMTPAQRAFVAEVVPGARQAQQRYGVPASVTIAQAIDESGWGQSVLASKDHNLFGIKGEGPAGTDTQLTQEYENGQWVVTAAPFRAYQNVSQSINDHGRLLATSDYYRQVMADTHDPDAFASALTGVYATDPNYGQTLIGLMRQFNLYQYDHATPAAQHQHAPAKPTRGKPVRAEQTPAAAPGQASVPGLAPPSPGASTGPHGSGTAPGHGSRPGASSPPRTGRPAPSSPPRGTRPTPSSPPSTGRPSPSSPPNSTPTPSSPPKTGRPPVSSPPRTGQPTASSPTRAGQSGPASSPRTTRPSAGSRPGNGTAPRGVRSAPGSMQGGTQPGTSSIPGAPQPVPTPSRGTAQPGTGASSAGRGDAATGSRPGAKASAKPVAATLMADYSPAPASAGATSGAPSASAANGGRTTATTATAMASVEPEHDGGTADWSPADWVPDWVPGWANEAAEPLAAEIADHATFTGQDGDEQDDDQSGDEQPDEDQASHGRPGIGQAWADSSGTGQTDAGRLATARLRTAGGLLGKLAGGRTAKATAGPTAGAGQGRYHRPLPRAVRNAFEATAEGPLLRAEPLYQDVAGHVGLRWELLAACDWMQCEAKPRHSPVHGEKLGTAGPDGTVYWTKSEALEQCAEDLVELARTVYGVDVTGPRPLSVAQLANAFAAFRWGELLKVHHTSAMEFPFSVAGLTVQHIGMRWPTINEPNAPDKPGSRFRMHFGAVPVLLSLGYPAAA